MAPYPLEPAGPPTFRSYRRRATGVAIICIAGFAAILTIVILLVLR
jgi:hypothetical protein